MTELERRLTSNEGNKGIFLSLEGIDGSGTTTHLKLLCEWLKRQRIGTIATQEPSNGEIGKLLRLYLKKKHIHPAIDGLLFAADRVEHYWELILPYLKKGYIVVSDRYKTSSLAYQTVSGLEELWVKEINSTAPDADLVILLDCPAEIALERMCRDDLEKFEVLDFLTKVQLQYIELGKHYQNVWIVESTGSIEQVQQKIRTKVQELIDKKSDHLYRIED